MSSELFRGLEFVQVGAVACFCSLGAATLTELLFPAYDSRRNTVWQGMEGILGMLFHYLVGLEAFTLLCPLRYIAYPATVFAVFTPVMLPNTLAKMNNTMSGLAGLVRPAATWTPPSPVGPPRPVPGSFQWDQALQKAKDGAARAVVDLRARMDAEVTDEVTQQVDALEAAMRSELGELYTDYLSSRDAKVKQVYDQLQQKWATTLASLRQSLEQAKVNAAKKLEGLGGAMVCLADGQRVIKGSDGNPVCGHCPDGYSWQGKTGELSEQYQLQTLAGDLVCKPKPSDPVVPPIEPEPFVKPPWGLLKGTSAYTQEPNACEKSLAGISVYDMPDVVDAKCGQIYPMMTTSALYQNQLDPLNGCVAPASEDYVFGTVREAGYEKTPACYTCVQPAPGENVIGYTLEKMDKTSVTCTGAPVKNF